MKKFLFVIPAVLVLANLAFGQSPAVLQAADDLAALVGRVSNLEERVAAIEQQPGRVGGKRTYSEAYRLALSRNLPLLAWNGAAVCPSCITDTDGTEFVHFVGEVPGCPADAITVSTPQGGELVGVGVVDSWIGGDLTYGHLPSVRRLLQRWRNRGFVVQAAPVTYQTTNYGYAQPMLGGGGGCATCGTSRGFFGRR